MLRSGHGLFTVFGDNGRYSKPHAAFSSAGRGLYLTPYCPVEALATDLTRAFHQIPLSRDSKKYSTLVTPF